MENDMTTGAPLKLITQFTIPLFLGNAFQQLYNMADTIIVGKFVSAGALAAVGATGTIIFFVLGIAIGMTTGFSVMTSQYYGAKNNQGVRYSVTNGMIMSLAFSIILTVFSLLIMPTLLHVMNTPEDIYPDALATSVSYVLAQQPSCFITCLRHSCGPSVTARYLSFSWCFPPASMLSWICF